MYIYTHMHIKKLCLVKSISHVRIYIYTLNEMNDIFLLICIHPYTYIQIYTYIHVCIFKNIYIYISKLNFCKCGWQW